MIHQSVADDDRASVGGAEQRGDIGVLSAAGFGGGGLGRDAGFVHRTDLGDAQAVASSRWPERQISTFERGSGTGPSTSTSAPVPRNCCTKRVKLSIHAGSYDMKPRGGGCVLPYMLSTTSRGCSTCNRAVI